MAARRKRPAYIERKAKWNARKERWEIGPFYFDEVKAQKAVDFFPKFLRFTKGEWAGKPFTLEPWQENDIVRPLFGWRSKADGTRRFTRAMVWVPRKNGKTELAAGIALLLLLGDGEYAGEIYTIASTLHQAKICFDQASSMVKQSDALMKLLEPIKTSIFCPKLMASIKPLSGKAEGKHGLGASGIIGDEVHEWRNGDLYQYVHDSEDARAQPLDFLISTAGKKGTYGNELYDESVSISDGTFADLAMTTLVVTYEADADADWTDEKVWYEANPNLGVSKKLKAMRENCKRAMRSPRLVNAFKNYQLNIWTEQAMLWLPIDNVDDKGRHYGWDHCIGPTRWQDLREKLKGKLCYGGLDLSSTTDITALVWFFPQQPDLPVPVLLPTFWKPHELLGVHQDKDKLPYALWLEQGALKTTPGNVVDYKAIERQVMKDAEQFNIAHINNFDRKSHEGGLAVDRWNATATVVNLGAEGIPVVMFGQGFASMSAPSKELERLILAGQVHHGGHPLLRQHAKTVAIESDAAGNIKPTKDKSSGRIDGMTASVNAIGISARPGVDMISPWEDDQFRISENAP